MAALVAVLAAACAAPTPPTRGPRAAPGPPTRPAPTPATPGAAARRPPAPPSPSPRYVLVPSLNLRRCPAVTCSRLAVLPQNEVVLRLGEDGEWVEVRVVKTGETGWVAARFLGDRPVAVGPTPPTPARPVPGQTFKEEFLE